MIVAKKIELRISTLAWKTTEIGLRRSSAGR